MNSSPSTIQAFDPFRFLLGQRDAIHRIAGSNWALLLGAIFVLTAGIARNYDHLQLLKNFEWIYGPFLASGATSLVVFFVVHLYLRLDKKPTLRSYLSFLSVYWMTAPCAWLYAIPVESMTDILTATKWNVAFLLIVSLWRVALITHSLSVLTKAGYLTCLRAVLLPSSVIMAAGSLVESLSLVNIMGGVRLPPQTLFLQQSSESLFYVSAILAFICLLSLTIPCQRAQCPLPWKSIRFPIKPLGASLVIVTVFVGLSIPVQIKVERNQQLLTLIQQSRYQDAINYASKFQRSDFLDSHFLPPDPYNNRDRSEKDYPELLKLLELQKDGRTLWLQRVWQQQYQDYQDYQNENKLRP